MDKAGDLESGVALGRYTILAELGHGGMADIYLARQAGPHGFERVCALKVMRQLMQGGEDQLDMFLDEARIASQLNHPNIVQIYDFGDEQGQLYLAMEYLAGETFTKVIKTAPPGSPELSFGAIARFVALAAGALHYAHTCRDITGKALQIVHRDISPDNLFVTYRGELKVLDFGIATAAHRRAQTQAGMLKGKIGYVSPEQFAQKEPDGRSDIYALGVVLFGALTAQHPFERNTERVIKFFKGELEPPRAHEVNPSVPQELSEIVSDALARERDNRPTGLELQRRLEAWLKTQVNAPTSQETAEWMQYQFAARIADRAAIMERALAIKPEELAPPVAPPPLPRAVPLATPPEPAPEQPVVDLHHATPQLSGPPPAGELLGELPPPAELPPVEPVVAAQAARTDIARPVDDVEPPLTLPPRFTSVTWVVAAVVALGLGDVVWKAASSSAPHLEPAPSSPPEPPPALPTPPTPAPILTPAPAPAALTPPTPPDPPVAVPSPPPMPPPDTPSPPTPAVKQPPAVSRAPRPAKGGTGTLDLDTDPWSSVYLGSTKLGDTPILGLQLEAGPHVLRLENTESRLSKTVTIEIRPGRGTKKHVDLRH